ncbi:MAG TPA: adenylate/guanylate cyclase domain-containing protein, partial [Spirochaetota bacterium]|nr:adenylate/guanylate cyclase domain-containing protein [Spirochaetota bacterium]
EPEEEAVPEKKEKKKKEKKGEKEKKVREIIIEEPGAVEQGAVSQKRAGKGFGGFFTSIQFKLIFIISLIIVLSLTGMIFLATYYFVIDNRVRIQESNHEVSSLLSLKVRSDFQSILDRSRRATETLLEKSRGGRASVTDLLFSTEKDFIFSGIAKKDAVTGELIFSETILNQSLMAELQINEENLKAVHDTHKSVFSRSLTGDTVVQNVSETLQIPVVGISYPIQIQGIETVDSIGVSYFRLDEILKAFRADQGISKGVNVFMVNDRGQVIAHPDSSHVLSALNFINIPIVKNMMKSPMNNGQTRYTDASGKVFLGSFRKIGVGGCGVIATVEEAKALQAVYDLQRRNIYLTVIILAMVIMVVFFFGKSLTTPIVRLVGATKKIKAGQYHVDIEPVSRDEIGELTASFIEMGRGLEEREKMKDAFGKFVNQEIAEQVLKGELQLGGERKVAAVFFSDIRRFTAISEKMEPEEVVEFLNEYMTRMVGCVNETFGVVDKFIGDAIMAIWGTPVSRGNDTENAVNAALLMRKELLEFNRDRGGDKRPIIQIGCGINTGPVLAGQIGSNDRMEYTVIGDTVNLASRIEALNKPFGTDILISEDSYELVKDLYRMEPMQKIKVKGKEGSQQIYAVLGHIDDPEAPKNVDELRKMLGIEMTEKKPEGEYLEEAEKKYEILEQ